MKYFLLLLCYLSVSQSFYSRDYSERIDLKKIVEGEYAVRRAPDVRSLPDGEHYTLLSKDRKAILKYAYRTGAVTDTLFHVDKARETKLKAIENYWISETGYRIILCCDRESVYRRSWKANLYDYDVRRNFLKPLSDTEGKLMIPAFSPDGRMCAFVRDNNIWLKKFDYDTESQVTKDGAIGKILNGITDWVYEEEFALTSLMAWSPDSKFLAFVKSDESEVPEFRFQLFDGSLYPGFETVKYPKAGERNSTVSCHVYNVDTKDIKQMNIPMEADGYIPRILFTENPEQLAVMTLNREQNIFSMYYVNPKSGVSRLVLRDENKYYIDSDFIYSISFTKDNFVYISEKDGFAHIYLYTANGILERQVTSGNWDVTALYGINPLTKTVYYQSAEESPLCRSVYAIDAKGKKTKLSTRTGSNSAQFNSRFTYYVHNFSDAQTPNLFTMHEEKGKELFVMEDNAGLTEKLKSLSLPQKEFFTFDNPEGISLNGWMLKPSGFEPSQRYPVLMVQYSGPNSQSVQNRFELGWENYLSEQGYIVACVDGRGTGARGETFRKCTYLNLGILESDDQIAAANYLAGLDFIDKNKIAIWGWSYGGTITLMSMSRGNGIFKAGVAIAPVTDWKFYDSIYSERYMRTPKENFTNYEQNSPIRLAGNLQGRLLLVHGSSDDNVHFQNSMYYAQALIEAGKQFEMRVYPNKNHSILGTTYRLHLYTGITDFLQRTL
ncbi:MAG: S9 family peptidase [Dysgonamonadaceae bacterium]|jgi:dipeptidyl-peptidase-4|nr:S9 family peptidase [Dysgonamonadaceae bacterium]